MTAILHKGIVKKVAHDSVTVMISTAAEDCGGCAISSMCKKREELTIHVDNPDPSTVGQEVSIGISSGSQRKAILLLLFVPILLVISALVVSMTVMAVTDVGASLIAFAVLAIWFLLMYAIRGRFSTSVYLIG